MEKAIRQAIINGEYGMWWDNERNQAFITSDNGGFDVSNEKIILDPLFWQALGKAEGWNQDAIAYREPGHVGVYEWNLKQYLCIDHINQGKSIDSFFEALIK